MVSRAIASLDAWLARAEKVLAEQRENAISPSLGLLEGGGHYEWTTTLAALSEGLGGLLESLCSRPGRWTLIVEDDHPRHLFWQALAYEDGSLSPSRSATTISPTRTTGPASKKSSYSHWVGSGTSGRI